MNETRDIDTIPHRENGYQTEAPSKRYSRIRHQTELICKPLITEDYVVQPIAEVSPPKWHLAHTTWFFETFVLKKCIEPYLEYDSNYGFLFNSYYEAAGDRVLRTDRGNLSRPSVEQVYAYRDHVDRAMMTVLSNDQPLELMRLVELGLNHEQQHQELLYTDIKYILGHHPLFPTYSLNGIEHVTDAKALTFVPVEEGLYQIGHKGNGFSYDNECARHKIWLPSYEIADRLVTNGEYLSFVEDGGYDSFEYWHSDGWQWVKDSGVHAPMYWHHIGDRWMVYTLEGLRPFEPDQPVTHINFYEAAAFAQWKGMRLPTEAEWEVAADRFRWGSRWEWTMSAYEPYPGFKKAEGALGEYNGKFMVNQMVLRGASVATPEGHSRKTYRNFFYPSLQWQFTGIRLAK